jgi:hypothetical protein
MEQTKTTSVERQQRVSVPEVTWEDLNEPGAYVERGTGDLYRVPREALISGGLRKVRSCQHAQGATRFETPRPDCPTRKPGSLAQSEKYRAGSASIGKGQGRRHDGERPSAIRNGSCGTYFVKFTRTLHPCGAMGLSIRCFVSSPRIHHPGQMLRGVLRRPRRFASCASTRDRASCDRQMWSATLR